MKIIKKIILIYIALSGCKNKIKKLNKENTKKDVSTVENTLNQNIEEEKKEDKNTGINQQGIQTEEDEDEVDLCNKNRYKKILQTTPEIHLDKNTRACGSRYTTDIILCTVPLFENYDFELHEKLTHKGYFKEYVTKVARLYKEPDPKLAQSLLEEGLYYFYKIHPDKKINSLIEQGICYMENIDMFFELMLSKGAELTIQHQKLFCKNIEFEFHLMFNLNVFNPLAIMISWGIKLDVVKDGKDIVDYIITNETDLVARYRFGKYFDCEYSSLFIYNFDEYDNKDDKNKFQVYDYFEEFEKKCCDEIEKINQEYQLLDEEKEKDLADKYWNQMRDIRKRRRAISIDPNTGKYIPPRTVYKNLSKYIFEKLCSMLLSIPQRKPIDRRFLDLAKKYNLTNHMMLEELYHRANMKNNGVSRPAILDQKFFFKY